MNWIHTVLKIKFLIPIAILVVISLVSFNILVHLSNYKIKVFPWNQYSSKYYILKNRLILITLLGPISLIFLIFRSGWSFWIRGSALTTSKTENKKKSHILSVNSTVVIFRMKWFSQEFFFRQNNILKTHPPGRTCFCILLKLTGIEFTKKCNFLKNWIHKCNNSEIF